MLLGASAVMIGVAVLAITTQLNTQRFLVCFAGSVFACPHAGAGLPDVLLLGSRYEAVYSGIHGLGGQITSKPCHIMLCSRARVEHEIQSYKISTILKISTCRQE